MWIPNVLTVCRENYRKTGFALSLSCSVEKWEFMGVFFFFTRYGQCWIAHPRTSLYSFDEYNDACMCLLARSTVTGNSWQQECSSSLLISLDRAQLHCWLAGFFIQQLPVNKSQSKAPSHPPPLISRDRLLTSICAKNNRFEPTWKGHCCISESDFQGHWPPV